jgi:hypothetical protein
MFDFFPPLHSVALSLFLATVMRLEICSYVVSYIILLYLLFKWYYSMWLTSELNHDIFITLIRHAAIRGRPVLSST